jgi:spermidine synthase
MGTFVNEREILDSAKTPDGGTISLLREEGDLFIRIDGLGLMSSRIHGSERAMARAGCDDLRSRAPSRVLVGGLGLGYTLRAVLDLLPASAEVICVELMSAIADWHRGALGDLAQKPLDDPRVRLIIGDVISWIASCEVENPGTFDAILLDIDNGPIPLTAVGNFWLYTNEGLHALKRCLKPGGTIVFWSAMEDDRFVSRMNAAGFETQTRLVDPRTGRRARRAFRKRRNLHLTHHVLFVGTKPEQ